ncbi:MAG TPA: DUF1272 domain-containing protein [Pseudomonas sp.]|nr:DUF1272 domain-containing protein [Pseudomonas sp.]
MLQLRPNCECCNHDLPADSSDVLVCSFECTFCRSCADQHLQGRGELLQRPRRPDDKVERFPASPPPVHAAAACPPERT